MAGPLDDLVARILRRVEVFAEEHGLEQASVEAELADGSLHRLATIRPDPGYGFLTLVPHGEAGEPEELVVAIGTIRQLRLSRAEAESPFGFGPPHG